MQTYNIDFAIIGRMTMIGLGDIALPGLIISFSLEVDKSFQGIAGESEMISLLHTPLSSHSNPDTYLFESGMVALF